MSKFKTEGRRHYANLGSSYMGAGRTEDSFTFRAKPSFSKIKQIYGEHLEINHSHYPKTKKHQKLDSDVKRQIIEKIKAEQRKVITRQVIIGTLVSVVLVAFGFFIASVSNFRDFLF